MSDETYKAYAVCENCDFSFITFITKGVPIVDEPCPHCGCKQLRKPDDKEMRDIQYRERYFYKPLDTAVGTEVRKHLGKRKE